MKRLIGIALLVASSSVLANPITDAVKEQAWPVYKCTMQVNNSTVITETNDTQYTQYKMIGASQEMFIYPIGDNSDLTLIVDNTYYHKDQKQFGAIAYIYKNKEIIGQYPGNCVLNK